MQVFGGSPGLDHRHDVGEQAVRGENRIFQFQLASFDLGQIEHHVDDLEQMLGGNFQFAQAFVLLRRQAGTSDEVRHTADGVQRRADFMTHVGEKCALGTVGGFCRIARQREFGSAFQHPLLQTAVRFPQQLFALEDGGSHVLDMGRQLIEFDDVTIEPDGGQLVAHDAVA